jgi:hypothetical protein
MEWCPATLADVKSILETDLAKCDDQQLATYRRYSVDPHFAPITRFGKIEKVVVVAENSGYAIYWEDVEEGFNISPTGMDGTILEHGCNQDELAYALNHWIEGRKTSGPE